MQTGAIWIGSGLLLALMLIATLNLALRVPSRARIADAFKQRGLGHVLERFALRRPEYMMATAIVRAALVLALYWVCLHWRVVGSIDELGPRRASAFVVALALALLFGVAIPSAWAKYAGEWLLVRGLVVLDVLRAVTWPVIWVLRLFDPVVRRLAGVPIRDAQSYADELEQEILDAVSEMERSGAVDEDEKEMIESVIDLRDRTVEEIMTPRTDIVALPRDTALEAAKELIRSRGHSRIPIFDETIDRILGVLYAKDLLHIDDEQPFDATRLMRRVSFIPESKPVRDLLREFQQEQVHMAIVLDEYGGTAGLVTFEDILEELVGEISDEYETAPPEPLQHIEDGVVEVDARFRIDDLNDELDIALPEDEDYETIGGFVFSTLGKIPKVGEECAHENVAIRVIGAEPRRVTRLRLEITPINGNHRNGQRD